MITVHGMSSWIGYYPPLVRAGFTHDMVSPCGLDACDSRLRVIVPS